MGAARWRPLGALVLAFTLPIAEAQAQVQCIGTSGTIAAGPGTFTLQTNFFDAVAGQSVTVTVTGNTGVTGSISYAGQTVNVTYPVTKTLTTATAVSNTQVSVFSFGPTLAGMATITCGAGNSGTGTGAGPSASTQLANNAAAAVRNSIQSTTIQGNAIGDNVIASLTPAAARPRGAGASTCPRCQELQTQLDKLQADLAAKTKELERADQTLSVADARYEKAAAALREVEADEAKYPRGIDVTGELKNATRDFENADADRSFARMDVANLQAEVNGLNNQITQTQADLRQAQTAAGIDPGPVIGPEGRVEIDEMPRSRQSPLQRLQSLMPRQSLRASLPEHVAPDLLAFDDRPKPPASGGFKIGRDDLIQLAQRPDGSNPLREALAGKWNIWTEGRFTGNTDAVANSSSLGFVGSLGADYKFLPWLTAGLSLGFETAQTATGVPGGRIGAFGVSAIPYVGARLDEHLFASAFFGITGLSYNTNPAGGITATYGGTRLFTGGSLTGVWRDGPWRLQPAASITYGSEAQTGYTDSAGTSVPGQTVQFGRAWAGPEVGYTFRDPDGAWSIEPYLRGQFNIDFATNEQVFLNGLVISTRSGASGTLAGGVSWQTDKRFSAKLEGSYESIGVAGLDLWSAMFRFNWSF